MLLDRSSEPDLEQEKGLFGWMKFSALVSYLLPLNFSLMAFSSGAQVLNQDVQVYSFLLLFSEPLLSISLAFHRSSVCR